MKSANGWNSRQYIIHTVWSVVIVLSLSQAVFGQGFQNLDFESDPIYVGPNPNGGGSLYAIPDWTANFNNTPQSGVAINLFVLDYTQAGLIVGPSTAVIDGNQSVYLSASSFGAPVGGSATENISQTGTVPSGVKSIQFKLGSIEAFGGTVDLNQPQNNFYMTLNNQIVPLLVLANTGSYLILAGDVSKWAGQTAQLSIGVCVPYNGNSLQEILYSGIIDDVSFSTAVVPEPSTLSISGISVILIMWCMKREKCRPTFATPIRCKLT